MTSPWPLRLACAGTLALTVAQLFVFPAGLDLSGGWITPIIAFELARTPTDLAFLAGPEAEPVRIAMDAGHRYDTVFPFFYAALLATSWASSGGRVPWAGALLAAVIVPLDLWENHVLGGLVDELRHGGTGVGGLTRLPLATWAKWGTIGVALAGLAVRLRHASVVVAALCGLAACSVPVGWATGRAWAGEGMAALVGLAFAGLMVRGVRWRPPRHVDSAAE